MAKKTEPAKTDKASPKGIETARTLSEALPYIQRYAGKTVTIKYGGHSMGDDALQQSFARDVVMLKQMGVNPIVVHGGGPQIGEMLERLQIKSSFVDGLRVTDEKTVDVVEMVLAGTINKQIVRAINQAGGRAVGLSGKDGNLIVAKKMRRTRRDPESNIEKILDLGFVGEPTRIDPNVIAAIQESDLIPVIAPIGIGDDGRTYNINADTVAGAIASAVSASRLILLTDVPGVLNKSGKLQAQLKVSEAKKLILDGTITGGMIPKVETCISALTDGAEGAVIVDGRVEHALLLELFTEHGAGTLLY